MRKLAVLTLLCACAQARPAPAPAPAPGPLPSSAIMVEPDCKKRIASASEAERPPEGCIVRVPPHAKKCLTDGPMVPLSAATQNGGAVTVRYLVRKSGKLAKVQKKAGDETLFAAVKTYLEGCKWEPATEGGLPVEAWGDQVFRFR